VGNIGTLVVILCIGSGFSTPAAAQSYVPGEILVKFRPGVSQAAADQFRAARGIQLLEAIPSSGVQRVAIPAGSTIAEMVEQCGADPDCEYAEPNYIGQGGFVPNDTSFSLQWHHNNTGQTGGTPDADIDGTECWDTSRGNAAIRIAVLDTGIDGDHPEFAGRILPGYDAVNEDNDPEADHSHGPYVTGIAAANANNSFAVAGVDHFVSIVPVKVLNSSNAGTSFDLAQGLDFADDEAEVISMSLINYPTGSFTINNALQAARDAGAILIACAGNGGIGDADVSGPGASPLTISVGATNDDDERASFSGTGSALDIVAPGSSVRTIAYNTSADTTTTFSGCSAATPIVGGMATLLLSVDPTLTHDEIATILTTTADDRVGPPGEDTPGRDDFFGYGRVNLNAALAAVSVQVPSGSPLAFAVLIACLIGIAWSVDGRTHRERIP
jgi:subtilisin family serine protease